MIQTFLYLSSVDFGFRCGRMVVMKKLTREQAIARFVAKHGGRYDYSKVVYITMRQEVIIGCWKCGEDFNITPRAHIHSQGDGCPNCTGNKTITKEELSKQGKEKFGDLFDYSLVECTGNKAKVSIVCNTCHKVFQMRPNNHLSGDQGCPYCRGFYRTTEEAIEDFKSVWDDEYDYSESIYLNTTTKIKVRCRKHGYFDVNYHHHMNEVGCPSCGKGGFDVNKFAWFYIIHCGDFLGFGITSDMKTRMRNHKRNLVDAGHKFRLFGVRTGSGRDIKKLEDDLIREFKQYRVRVEVEGFRREAISIDKWSDVLNYVENYNPKENRPEGRSD